MLRALDAMNNLGSLMTSRTTSRELKATNAMKVVDDIKISKA